MNTIKMNFDCVTLDNTKMSFTKNTLLNIPFPLDQSSVKKYYDEQSGLMSQNCGIFRPVRVFRRCKCNLVPVILHCCLTELWGMATGEPGQVGKAGSYEEFEAYCEFGTLLCYGGWCYDRWNGMFQEF